MPVNENAGDDVDRHSMIEQFKAHIMTLLLAAPEKRSFELSGALLESLAETIIFQYGPPNSQAVADMRAAAAALIKHLHETMSNAKTPGSLGVTIVALLVLAADSYRQCAEAAAAGVGKHSQVDEIDEINDAEQPS